MGYHWDDGGYSSEVEIYLLVDNRRYAVAQVGPDSIILRDGDTVRGGHAQLVINVDGRTDTHDVFISASAPCNRELEYA